MEQVKCLKFDLNLQRLSALAVAEYFWETPTTVKEIENYAKKIYDHKGSPVANEKKWHDLTQKVLDQIANVMLPSSMISELQKVTILIGEKIFLWFVHIITDAEFHVRYTHNIRWTSHGIIDEYKIFQDWTSDPRFPDTSAHPRSFLLATIGSRYADEKLLRENLKDVAKIVIKYAGVNIKDFSKFKVNSAMAPLLLYVICKGDFDKFDLMYAGLKSKEYPGGENKLFGYCVINGFEKAAEYYYKRLKEKDKATLVYKAASDCVKSGVDLNIHHVSERTPEVLLYLLYKMSNAQKKRFLTENIINVYSLFLNTWPYKEFCIPILDFVWDGLAVFEPVRLLDVAMTVLKDFAKNRWDIYKEMHQPILQHLLSKISKEDKVIFFQVRPNEFYEFFKRSDFLTVRTIVNDPDLKRWRSDFINISFFIDKNYFINGGKTELVYEYMRVLQFSEEERNELMEFASDYELLGGLLTHGLVSEVEKLLTHQKTEEDVIMLKRDLREFSDPVKICQKLVANGKYDLILEYLKFPYPDEDVEEFEEVKSKIFSIKFIRAEFYRIWLRNRKWNVIKKEATKLLQYFLKMDDVVTWFKKEKLVSDENSIKLFCDMYEENIKPKRNLFNELFKFCSVPDDKIKEIKGKVMRVLNEWLDSYVLENSKFLILNEVINWACSEDQKKEVIGNYLNSPKGASFFRDYTTMVYSGGVADDVKGVFINEWMACGNTDKMKNVIQNLGGSGDPDEDDFFEGNFTNFVFEGLTDLLNLMQKRKK